MSNELKQTLGNESWMRANEDKIKEALPDVWTLFSDREVLRLGFRLKLLGIPWRDYDQLTRIFAYLERIGFLLRTNGQTIRANPSRVMP